MLVKLETSKLVDRNCSTLKSNENITTILNDLIALKRVGSKSVNVIKR